MLMRNMKKDEVLNLLSVLIPGSVWASIDYQLLEHEKLSQTSLDVCKENLEENAASGDTIVIGFANYHSRSDDDRKSGL